MQKTNKFLALTMAALCLAACQTDQGKKDTDLASWEGSYPTFETQTQKPYPAGETFWDNPKTRAMLADSLPDEIENKVLNGWDGKGGAVSVPIQRRGNLLLVSVCKPHSCYGDAAQLFFNLATGTVQACWSETEEGSGAGRDVWISKTTVRPLDPGSCRKDLDFALYDKFAG